MMQERADIELAARGEERNEVTKESASIATLSRVLRNGLPIIEHEDANTRNQTVVWSVEGDFIGMEWRRLALEVLLFQDISNVQYASDTGTFLALLSPDELPRSLRITYGDGIGVEWTLASVELAALLTNGLRAAMSNANILKKIKRRQSRRRSSSLTIVEPDTITRRRSSTAGTATSTTATSWTERASRRVSSAAERLEPVLYLYDENRDPLAHRRQQVPLRTGTRCEILFLENAEFEMVSSDQNDPVYAFIKRKFEAGTYCCCAVQHYDETTEMYDLIYASGPFFADDDVPVALGIPSTHPPIRFIKVKRAHIVVDYVDLPPRPTLFGFIVLVSFLQLLVFVIIAQKRSGQVTASSPIAGPELLWLRSVGAFPGCRDKRPQLVWRLVSYSLVHAGAQHVSFNIFLQLLFGLTLERVHGTSVGIVYICGVVTGALCSIVFRGYDAVVGASAGVYCLIGAHVGNLALNWNRMHRGILARHTRLAIYSTLIIADVIQYATSPQNSVSYVAHLGGFSAGILLAFAVLVDLDDESFFRRKYLHATAGLVLCLFVLALLLAVIFAWPPPSIGIKTPCCETLLRCTNLDRHDDLSCSDDTHIYYQGFYHDHSHNEGATCGELKAYYEAK